MRRENLAAVGVNDICFDEGLLQAEQSASLVRLLQRVQGKSKFYQKKFAQAGVDINEIKSIEDIVKLPFTEKDEIRREGPLDLRAADEEEIIRIHSTSGTTGKPVIIPYTKKDVDDWAIMMERCMRIVGIHERDRVQITPGYGLWTAGIGFQNGCEHLGAMAIPMGPGNTDKQLEMMVDLQATHLIGTASYALLLAEEANKRGIADQLHLRAGIFGSERWGEKMRQRLEQLLGIESYDIYGLTEIYGPGIGIDCAYHEGMHYYPEFIYIEIIDPQTGKVLPHGQLGELVITTLVKEGAPLIRYRTRDLSFIYPRACSCGRAYPRIGRILGRSDDTLKIKGINVYPGQVEDVIKMIPGVSSEYQMIVKRKNGRDEVLLRVEEDPVAPDNRAQNLLKHKIKAVINIIAEVEIVPYQALPRSEKKSKRIFDQRNLD